MPTVRSSAGASVPLGGSQLDKRDVRAQLKPLLEEYMSAHDVSEVRRRAAPHVHAAVALQAALDQEMGGWPNTFG